MALDWGEKIMGAEKVLTAFRNVTLAQSAESLIMHYERQRRLSCDYENSSPLLSS
jgi:hypothetical protein